MENIINDLGVHLTQFQYGLLQGILFNVIKTDISHLSFTSSSGNSIIILDKDVVYQFFLYPSIYHHVLKVGIAKIPGFVSILDFDDRYQLIIFERVEPVVNVYNNKLYCNLVYLLNDVFHTLLILKKWGVSHNDLTLDNIGYSPKRNRYLIYDFESVNFDSDTSSDLYTLLKSVQFRINL